MVIKFLYILNCIFLLLSCLYHTYINWFQIQPTKIYHQMIVSSLLYAIHKFQTVIFSLNLQFLLSKSIFPIYNREIHFFGRLLRNDDAFRLLKQFFHQIILCLFKLYYQFCFMRNNSFRFQILHKLHNQRLFHTVSLLINYFNILV